MASNYSIFKTVNLGFIGGGNMAKAIATGLLTKGVFQANQIHVSARSESTLSEWERLGAHTEKSNRDIMSKCNIIVLAFKPYQLSDALATQNVTVCDLKGKVVVSLLVGVSCETVFNKLNECMCKDMDLVRAMPNLSVATGEGCTALSWFKGDMFNFPGNTQLVQSLFSSIGRVEVVGEDLMEPLAALIGSGPAFIFMTIEALADGAVKHGVPRQLAKDLAAQMVLGASKLVIGSNKHPGQLKDEVCSPGGTTICGVHELEKGNLRATFINAIEAAVQKGLQIKEKQSR